MYEVFHSALSELEFLNGMKFIYYQHIFIKYLPLRPSLSFNCLCARRNCTDFLLSVIVQVARLLNLCHTELMITYYSD